MFLTEKRDEGEARGTGLVGIRPSPGTSPPSPGFEVLGVWLVLVTGWHCDLIIAPPHQWPSLNHLFYSHRQPWFYGWGFNLPRGQALLEKWNLIPEGVDILITHGPPLGKRQGPPLGWGRLQGVGCWGRGWAAPEGLCSNFLGQQGQVTPLSPLFPEDLLCVLA